MDLVDPGDQRVVVGRFPAGAKKAGIAGFPVPQTGAYTLVFRAPTGSAAGRPYSFGLKVKQAKANKSRKGAVSGEDVVFDAMKGSLLSFGLKGEGLTSGQVSLLGPGGEIPYLPKEGKGKVAVKKLVLDDTGAYRLQIDHPGPVSYKVSVKLPK